MYVHACYWKLTGEAWVELGVQGVIYEAVRHVSKHNTHEREHYTVDHGHHRPRNEQQNVPAVCEPELKTKKKQQESQSVCGGGGEFWITQSEQGENFQVWGVIMFSQWGTGGVHPNNGRMCRTPILSPCFPSYLIHTHTHHILLLCSLMDYNIYKKKHIVSSTVQICGTLYFYSITLIW